MDVGVEREAGRVVAEPALHLHDVAPLREQPRRDGMAERVEAGPLDTRRPRRSASARGTGTSRFEVARLQRADDKTLAAAAAHALANLHVRTIPFERKMATFEYEQLRAPQTCRGEQREHDVCTSVHTPPTLQRAGFAS